MASCQAALTRPRINSPKPAPHFHTCKPTPQKIRKYIMQHIYITTPQASSSVKCLNSANDQYLVIPTVLMDSQGSHPLPGNSSNVVQIFSLEQNGGPKIGFHGEGNALNAFVTPQGYTQFVLVNIKQNFCWFLSEQESYIVNVGKRRSACLIFCYFLCFC